MKEMGKYSVALFVDSPNMMRREYEFGLRELVEVTKEYGKIFLKKIYFTHTVRDERPKLVEAAVMNGFEPIFSGLGDVDTRLVCDAKGVLDKRDDIDLIAMATSDSDVLPIIYAANDMGKNTLVLFGESCPALQNASRYSRDMKKYMERKRKGETTKEP